MVRMHKYKSMKRKTKSKKKSRKHLKSKNNLINKNVSGYIYQIKCHNNVCNEYKKQINSFDDLNKLFELFRI